MSSLYHNPDIANAMSGQGPADRFVRSVGGPLEQQVSVTVMTNPTGDCGWVLSIDIVDPAGNTISARPLGAYSFARQAHVQADALMVARILLLPLRLACPANGWRVDYDPDGPAIVAPTGDPFKAR